MGLHFLILLPCVFKFFLHLFHGFIILFIQCLKLLDLKRSAVLVFTIVALQLLSLILILGNQLILLLQLCRQLLYFFLDFFAFCFAESAVLIEFIDEVLDLFVFLFE